MTSVTNKSDLKIKSFFWDCYLFYRILILLVHILNNILFKSYLSTFNELAYAFWGSPHFPQQASGGTNGLPLPLHEVEFFKFRHKHVCKHFLD